MLYVLALTSLIFGYELARQFGNKYAEPSTVVMLFLGWLLAIDVTLMAAVAN